MDEKDWRFIDLLYKEKSISKVSNKIFISQPALSSRLLKIEDEMGVKLILRTNKGVEFTEAGIYLAKEANKMMIYLSKLKETLLQINENTKNIIVIGAGNYTVKYRINDILNNFKNLNSNIQFKIINTKSRDISNLLQDGTIDIGFGCNLYKWDGKRNLLEKEKVVVISKKEITLEDLPNLEMIDYQTDLKFKKSIIDWYNDSYKSSPNIGIFVSSLDLCLSTLIVSDYYAIVPQHLVENDLRFHILDATNNLNSLYRSLWILYRDNFKENKLLTSLINYIILNFR
ncbi:LysR family transcriptional regulator [Fusobacterium nucleatum]|jgi:transcriptional regulator, LysR family|uniref:LysR family transcriptional regulator n=1 Tax=Fusobacterium nucleatum TaxID=851 RepID=UPI0025E140F9|nr:LysR family transcriptional regulator [uncultured Fusobacterium sp.]